jgi:hypothetical protein
VAQKPNPWFIFRPRTAAGKIWRAKFCKKYTTSNAFSTTRASITLKSGDALPAGVFHFHHAFHTSAENPPWALLGTSAGLSSDGTYSKNHFRPARRVASAMHDPTAALAVTIMCLVCLYCAYKVVYPELQKRQKEAAHQKLVRQQSLAMVADLAKQAGCVLLDENENVNDEAMRALFKTFDQDSSGTIDKDELMQMAIVILGADKSVCGCSGYGCGIV